VWLLWAANPAIDRFLHKSARQKVDVSLREYPLRGKDKRDVAVTVLRICYGANNPERTMPHYRLIYALPVMGRI
jgi:hypothetical protein